MSRSVDARSRTLIASDAATLNQFVAPTPMIANGRTVYLDTASDCVQRLHGVLKPSADDALLVEGGIDDVAATADEIVVGLMAPQSDRLAPLVARFIVEEKAATIGASPSTSTAVEAQLVSAVRRLLQQRGAEFADTKARAENLVDRFVTIVVD